MDTNTSLADILIEIRDTMKELTEQIAWVAKTLEEIEG